MNTEQTSKNIFTYKCRCECIELIDKGVCDKGSIWNPSNWKCECDKSCDIGEYLDHENCKCRKKMVNTLVEKCTENVEEVKLAKITSAENENKHKCSSCTLCIKLFSVIFTINIAIGPYFIYFYWYLKMLLVLSLVPILEQQFNECNSIKLIYGKSHTN